MKSPLSQQVTVPIWMVGGIISFWLLALGWIYNGYQNRQRDLSSEIATLRSETLTIRSEVVGQATRASVLEVVNVDVVRRLSSIEAKVDRLIEAKPIIK